MCLEMDEEISVITSVLWLSSKKSANILKTNKQDDNQLKLSQCEVLPKANPFSKDLSILCHMALMDGTIVHTYMRAPNHWQRL